MTTRVGTRTEPLRKQARLQVMTLERELQNGNTLDGAQRVRALDLARTAHDRVLVARMELLTGSVGASAVSPDEALATLERARQTFEANVLGREGLLTQLEAASQLLLQARPQQALAALRRCIALGSDTGGMAGRWRATQALALAALGRMSEATGSALTALGHVHHGSADARCRRLTLQGGLKVLLAARLNACATVSFMSKQAQLESLWTQRGAATALDSSTGNAAAVLRQTAAQDHGAMALVEFVHAASGSDGQVWLTRLAHLAAALSSETTPPQAHGWLYLGTAYRLAGHLNPALNCLQRALDLARRSDHTQTELDALFELSLVQVRRAEYQQACTLMFEMQRREAENRQAVEAAASDAAAAGPTLADAAAAQPDAAGAGLHVRRAMQYIQAQFASRLTVTDIARHCGVSRRTLEIAFREQLKSSVAETVRQLRVKAVTQQLVHTSHPIKRIAVELGFGSTSSLCREFRRATGSTPAVYRRKTLSQRVAPDPVSDDEACLA